MLKAYNPKTIAAPVGKYQHAVEGPTGTRMLLLAGQFGNLPDGSVPKTIEGQAKAAWNNIKGILADAGMGLGDLVKVTLLLVDKTHVAASRAARDKVFGGTRPPASTLMVIGALASPDYLIEIEAIAAEA
jgi:enamine deaminase RidA (YjgF/YER057c/UK114 family)